MRHLGYVVGLTLLLAAPAVATAQHRGSIRGLWSDGPSPTPSPSGSGDPSLTPQQRLDTATGAGQRRSDDAEVVAAEGRGINAGLGWLQTGASIIDSFEDLRDAYEHLAPEDAQFDPNFEPSGQPQIPSSCVDAGNEACAACYAEAYEKLNFVRFYLERLRAIYGSYSLFAKKAMAFGDTSSGIHAVSGLAWQAAKRDIEASLSKLQGTYDDKYRSYMESLEAALHMVSECEAKHFDQPDWYSRYGFMYFTFMQDRYRRAD